MSLAPYDWLRERLRESAVEPAEPTMLGRYQLFEEIGRGAMGRVHRAIDTTLGRAVALKILASSDPASPPVQRFRREAALAASLRHPNIIAVHDVGEAPGDGGVTLYFIAMDLVVGRTFKEFLGTPDALRMLEEIARAAGHAHARGIVHRDLKPENVLVDDSGRAVLTDFGLARAETETRMTRDGAVLGTPVYMAPEQVEGRNDDVGPRTDVYALGVILYEILAGRPPFVGATAAEVYSQILTSDPPRTLRPNSDLEAICFKALDKEPARRYATGDEFAEELSRARRGEPVLATHPGAITIASRWLRRRPARMTVAAVLLLSLALLGAMYGRNRVLLARALARASQAATLETRRDAWREAADLGSADARREFDAVNAEIRKRDDERESARRAADERVRAQERASKQLELGRPSLERALALLVRADASAPDVFKLADAALEAFRTAHETAPWLAETRYLLGRAADLRGDPEAAERHWREALSLDPSFGPARFQLGRSLLVKAWLATFYERSRGDAEKLAAASAEAFEASMASGSGFDDAVQREAARAMLAHVQGRAAAARMIASEALVTHRGRPGIEDFHWILGLASTPAEAPAHHDRALALRAVHIPALFARGFAHIQLRHFPEAEQDFARAAAFWPRSRDAWNCLGTAIHAQGRAEAAIVAYTEALACDTAFTHALSNRAMAHLHRVAQMAPGDAARAQTAARADYDLALTIAPNFVLARLGRGELFMAAGELELALADFNAAVRVDPTDGPSLIGRAMARRALGDLDGALADLDACLARHPDNADALRQRSTIRYQLKDLEGAISDLDRALKVAPNALAFANRGAFKLLRGDHANAIDDFTEALKLRPDHLDARMNRAIARLALKQWDAAIEDAEEILRRAPAGSKQRAEAERLRETARRGGE